MNNPYGSRFEREDPERRGLRESRDQRYGGERRFRGEEHNDERFEGESANRQSYGRDDDYPFGGEQRWSGQRGYSSNRRFGGASFQAGQSDWRSYPGQTRSFERGGYESDREPWESQRSQYSPYGQRPEFEGRYGSSAGYEQGQPMGSRASGGYRESGGYLPGHGPQSGQHSGSSNYWEHGGGGRSYQPGYGEQGYGGMAGNAWQHGGRFGAASGSALGSGFRGRPPKGYARSDERLREDICERLMSTPWIDAGDVSVEVRDGNVTLEGTVPERSMKHRIEDVAEECSGVKNVDNRIRVEQQEFGGGYGAGQPGASMAGSQRSPGAAQSGGTHASGHAGAQAAKSK